MNGKAGGIVAAMLVTGAGVWAQQPPGGSMGPGMAPGMPPGMGQRNPVGARQGDLMAEQFFPPELIMQNQRALGLTEDQRSAIKEAMQKSVVRLTDLQWQQSAESEVMTEMVKQVRIDEGKTLAQLDKLLGIETDIKRLQMGVWIKVKNALTPEQHAKLREIKRFLGAAPGVGPQDMPRPDRERMPPSPGAGPQDPSARMPPREPPQPPQPREP